MRLLFMQPLLAPRNHPQGASLRKHLAGRVAVFSVERFMREVREAVRDAARAGTR